MKQKTIKKEVKFKGVGVHTGNLAKAVIKPAPAGNGINFIRKDLEPEVVITADIENVSDVVRGTALENNGVQIYTVEHVLAACAGLGIYNLNIELNSNEFPVGDGSSKPIVELFEEAGIEELKKEQSVFKINEIIEVTKDDTYLIIKPYNGFKVSFTIEYDHSVIGCQFKEVNLNEQVFKDEIMFARTFGFYKDYEKLKSQKKAGGSSLENTVGLDEKRVLNPEGLRASDEFVRHKILDLIGDFSLAGIPVNCHVIACKVGHALNVEAVKKIRKLYKAEKMARNNLDIEAIKSIIPHRYPFLLVDRIIAIEEGKRALGVKNVTVNENFFQGHFPVRPVMPGVLIIEALAQVSGVFLLSKDKYRGKLPYFAGIDNVRFKKPVVPGDVLKLEVIVVKIKGSFGKVKGIASVDGKMVAKGDLMFSLVDV
ncbi:MAG: UDP-3-O-acyl-N-acetylglucosamine deacetylase [Candidatus Muiribacteriota bacterium]